MTRPSGHRPHRGERDGGFALIEVIVALFLLSLVASAILALFFRGMQATSHLQRNQSADAVAAEAMAGVRSISAVVVPGGTSGIVRGRAQADVQTVWAAAALVDTAGSTAVWDHDPAVTTSVNATVPLVADTVRSGIHYTVTTLIGQCYRLAAGSGADQACIATNPGTYASVFRVTVVVSWNPTSSGQCSGTRCIFRMSSFVDPNPESNWNLSAKPLAYDDDISAVAGDPLTAYEIMANDVIGSVTSNPVTMLTSPAFGTATVITSGASMGMLNYTPLAASGRTSLTYMLRDGAGRTSDPGTVNITVLPKAVNDSASVPLAGSVDIDVVANDLGTFAVTPTIAIVGSPGVGSASVVAGKIRYAAPASGSATSLTYTVTDTSTLVSATATVSITLTPALPPAADLSIPLLASASVTARPLDILIRTGNPAGYKVFVVSGPTKADPGWSALGALSGSGSSAITYSPVANGIGVYTLTYYVQDTTGVQSATKTVTLTVSPVAVGDATSVVKKLSTTVNVASNDLLPASGMTYTLGALGGTACGTASVVASTGAVTFNAPSSGTTGSCSVPYTVTKIAGGTTLSATATLVVTVTP